MKNIFFNPEFSIENNSLALKFKERSNFLIEEFETKYYGKDLDSIWINVIFVSPKFDSFSIVRPIKIKNFKEPITDKDGNRIVFGQQLQCDIKIDYSLSLNFKEDMFWSNIIIKLESTFLKFFENKKIDFDWVTFISDLKSTVFKNITPTKPSQPLQ